MSKPRYGWWGYVKDMIRRYPALAEQYRELHMPTMTANYGGLLGGGGDGRSLERLAIRELPTTQQREYEAVRRAIRTTERYRNGADRLRVVRYVFWEKHQGRRLVEEAARDLPCSYASAKQWHREFIRLVASNFGLLDE